jgi:hypothetical protein
MFLVGRRRRETPPIFGRDSRRVRERMEYRNVVVPVAR